jgi:hypothetical protein
MGEDWGATNDVTIWLMRVACWSSKATCTYAHARAHAPGYPHARTHARTHRPVSNTRIAFPRQQWCRERALMLRYEYVVCAAGVTKFQTVTLRFAFLCFKCSPDARVMSPSMQWPRKVLGNESCVENVIVLTALCLEMNGFKKCARRWDSVQHVLSSFILDCPGLWAQLWGE